MSEKERIEVITPEAIIAWPNLFEAKPINDGNTDYYSATFIFPEGTDLSELKAAAQAKGEEYFGKEKFAQLLKAGNVTMPFRYNAEEKGYPEGSTFINTKSKFAPDVIDRYADPKSDPEDPQPLEITDPDAIYPGCIVRGQVSPYGYDHMGNKGVSFGLDGVQRWADGERLDGRTSPGAAFNVEMPAETDLSDLEGEEEQEPAAVGQDNDLSALM